jgi:hypothetical protein
MKFQKNFLIFVVITTTFLAPFMVLGNEKCTAIFFIGEGELIRDSRQYTDCSVACGVGCNVGKAGKNLIDLASHLNKIESKVGNWDWEIYQPHYLYRLKSETIFKEYIEARYRDYKELNSGLNPSITQEEFSNELKRTFAREGINIPYKRDVSSLQIKNINQNFNLAGLLGIGWWRIMNIKWYQFLYSSYKKLKIDHQCQAMRIRFKCDWGEGLEDDQKKLGRRKAYIDTPVKFGARTFTYSPSEVPKEFSQDQGFMHFLNTKMGRNRDLPRTLNCGDSLNISF